MSVYPLMVILADMEEMANKANHKKMLNKILEAQAWAEGWWAGFTHAKNESYYNKVNKERTKEIKTGEEE